jgi:hypothetical protein
MNVLTLRSQLALALNSYLGTYTLANTATTPAISVRAVGDSLPPSTRVSGLECVILQEPELIPIRQYALEHAFQRWTIYLVDWDGNTPLNTVAGRLLWLYPGSNAVSITVPRSVGPRSQMRIDIQTNPDPIVA